MAQILFILTLFLTLIASKTGYAVLKPKDLEPGDLIFFMTPSGKAEHVAIYKKTKDGVPWINHSVGDNYNTLIATQLLPPGEHNPYHVVRNRNRQLSYSASRRMSHWEMKIPYDVSAFDFVTHFAEYREFGHFQFGPKKLLEYAKSQYRKRFYRRIKYAAKRDLPVMAECNIHGSTGKKGFRCSEAVVLAFQVEELASMVKPCQEVATQWVSDKYVLKTDPYYLNASERYHTYQKQLERSDEYPLHQTEKRTSDEYNHRLYSPSIAAWNYETFGSLEEFINLFESVLPFDSKIITPESLYLYVTENDEINWENLGVLEVNIVLPRTAENRLTWRKKVRRNSLLANQFRIKSLENINQRPRSASLSENKFVASQQPDFSRVRSKSFDQQDAVPSAFHAFREATKKTQKQIAIFATPARPKPGTSPKLAGLVPNKSGLSRIIDFGSSDE